MSEISPTIGVARIIALDDVFDSNQRFVTVGQGTLASLARLLLKQHGEIHQIQCQEHDAAPTLNESMT